ncbi:unnamed protein product [Brassicogethes aeneus]|uniref:DUF7041 domain-containing protein n=1 Tax=Brassicogethes aeneus TaxID=1431903 RepID=A0A9P0AZ60_BRAAE|nr:unnamed protein product [Brassicogethes aeneus]
MEALQEQFQQLQKQNEALLLQLQQQQQQKLSQQDEEKKQVCQTTEPPSSEVHRVTVKLPPFWKDKPTLWFAQVEAQFMIAHITQEITKYSYVISHLDERYANEVEDLIINPPANTPYTTLKTEIIRRLSVSEERRVRQLLMEEELGDRTPSQFLRHLRSLVASSCPRPGDSSDSKWTNRPQHRHTCYYRGQDYRATA